MEKEQIEGYVRRHRTGREENENFKLKLTDVKATFPYHSVHSEVGAL